ncbi:MAG: hypothetical protein J6D08_13280 [Lachnospiraceae bacterium]|nr:hypothetical protein [Lachnospiraceae bacterium]
MGQETYDLFEYEFMKDSEETYLFNIKRMYGLNYAAFPGKVKYRVFVIPEQCGSAVWLFLLKGSSKYAKNRFAWELRSFMEKKIEAVRVE